MPLPTVEQYSQLIEQKAPSTLSTLIDHHFLFLQKNNDKEFCFSVGTSAAVFKAEKEGKHYAIRCFLRGELETFRRYQQLADFFRSKNLSWEVPFEFLDNEILLNGQFYPVVKMEWVEGTPLNKFIDTYSVDSYTLSKLQRKLVDLSANLEENGVGHGDLKYNNIILQNEGVDIRLKLIDYDSMFIPAFKGRKNLETGSSGFQPLKRLSSHFSEIIDRFSIWVMLTTLEAVKVDAKIWQDLEQGGFNNEHSLFSASDFFNPSASAVFQRLKRYNHEALNYYLEKIILHSKAGDLNTIDKPHIYKETAAPTQKQVQSPRPAPPPSQPFIPTPAPEKKYEVEIKTIPSGKDVLVRGIKKGITPLRILLLKNETAYIEVLNEGEKVPVLFKENIVKYEFDFSKKSREPILPLPPEPDEIIEFHADKYFLQEGEPATINWKVKGQGKIHISNLGEIAERTGTKKIVVNRTTDYVLTIGTKNRSLTINVQPKPKPTSVQSVPVIEKKEPKAIPYAKSRKQQSTKNPTAKILIGLLLLAGVTSASYFVFKPKANTKPEIVQQTQANAAAPAKAIIFTDAGVTSFLDGLYQSYNNRNLSSIMSHYSGSVNEYYDSKSLSKDSLSNVINSLFITPAAYSCTPDFTTMKIEKKEQTCKVVITIKEKLKSDRRSRTESYTTTIEYLLDPSYKIVSEKSPG